MHIVRAYKYGYTCGAKHICIGVWVCVGIGIVVKLSFW